MTKKARKLNMAEKAELTSSRRSLFFLCKTLTMLLDIRLAVAKYTDGPSVGFRFAFTFCAHCLQRLLVCARPQPKLPPHNLRDLSVRHRTNELHLVRNTFEHAENVLLAVDPPKLGVHQPLFRSKVLDEKARSLEVVAREARKEMVGDL